MLQNVSYDNNLKHQALEERLAKLESGIFVDILNETDKI